MVLLVTRGGGIASVLPRGIAAAINISLTFVSSETHVIPLRFLGWDAAGS